MTHDTGDDDAEIEIVTLRQLKQTLRRPGFSSQDMDQLIEQYGRAALLAYLDEELERRGTSPRLHGYPPVFFLSYKWEDDALFRWVKQFADALEAQGYRVLLDQDSCQADQPTDVPKYIARMADCHYLVMIGTPAYVQSGTWVFDEINLALVLKNARHCVVIPVIKDDDTLSDVSGWFITRVGANAAEILDFRGVDDPTELVRKRFKPYRGMTLTDAEQEQFRQALARVKELIEQGAIQPAIEKFNGLPEEWRSTIDVQVQAARLHLYCGNKAAAASIARDVLKTPDITESMVLDCIHVLCLAESYLFALWEIGKLLPYECHDKVRVHYLAGIALWESSEFHSALNHFLYCLRLGVKLPELLSYIGEIFQAMGEHEQAEGYLRKAIQTEPTNPRAWSYLVILLRDRRRQEEANSLESQGKEAFPQFDEWIAKARDESQKNAQEMRYRVPRKSAVHAASCPSCDSHFASSRGDDQICEACGTVRMASSQKCACGNSPAVRFTSLQQGTQGKCPICRASWLQIVS